MVDHSMSFSGILYPIGDTKAKECGKSRNWTRKEYEIMNSDELSDK
jgi:hypothetical protein